MKKAICLILFWVVFASFKLSAQTKEVPVDSTLLIEKGIASYYGRFFHNRRTSNGEIFDMEGMTAAHKNLPFGTMVRVTNLKNEKEVIVKINDRLPQNSKRTIDLAKGAARKLGMIQMGLAPVNISVLKPEVVTDLIDYYSGEAPETLRLRVYSQPIEIEKDLESLFSWTALEPSI
ncbi:septal ring lytic transglycosylase RlpA family protein [Echinicola salinicaeni]|uniref:septal ring lytic transglycosylase RlpA family protein n=1 Tax=Echinicola salinicaeni TaxID=2762757 RepID=UPI001646AB10|nr:septal ring lytic transglycosylase RlpA family protein [Echinicola salinicaeni]